MSSFLLPHETTPEDIALNCIWSSQWRTPADEVRKFGTINGTPTINNGLTLNGTTDYISYGLNGQFTEPQVLGFHTIFEPSFSFADGSNHYLFDTAASLQYTIRKTATDLLGIYFGGVNAALVDVSALWVQNGRNVLTSAADGATVNSWFNGVQIHTSVAVVWTPTVVTELHIGQRSTGDSRWGGSVDIIKIYNSLLSEQSHLNLWLGAGI